MKIEPKELHKTADVSAGHSDWRDKLRLIFSVLFIFLGIYILAMTSAQVAIQFFPDSFEKGLSEIFDKQFDDKGDKEPKFATAQKIFERLKSSGLERDLDYKLCYIDDEMVNAFALPGGTICLTKGLLENVSKEKGLAMVIGHELGHHQHKHLLQRMTSMLVLQSLVAFTTGYNLEGLGGNILNFYFVAHGREQEYEADSYGLKLVRKVYGTTDDILEFYRFAESKQGTSEISKMAAWLQTHPHMSDRIERIEKISTELN